MKNTAKKLSPMLYVLLKNANRVLLKPKNLINFGKWWLLKRRERKLQKKETAAVVLWGMTLYKEVFIILSNSIESFVTDAPDVRTLGPDYLIEKFELDKEKLTLESQCLCAFLITFSFQRRFANFGTKKIKAILDLFHALLILEDSNKINKELLFDRYKSYYPIMKTDIKFMAGAQDIIPFRDLVLLYLNNLLSTPIDATKDLMKFRLLLSININELFHLLLNTYDMLSKKYNLETAPIYEINPDDELSPEQKLDQYFEKTFGLLGASSNNVSTQFGQNYNKRRHTPETSPESQTQRKAETKWIVDLKDKELVRIIDLHPEDGYFSKREEILGAVIRVWGDVYSRGQGWYSIRATIKQPCLNSSVGLRVGDTVYFNGVRVSRDENVEDAKAFL